MPHSRRWILQNALLGGAGLVASPAIFAADDLAAKPEQDQPAQWRKGIEGQRIADLGNGYYLNPIFSGDHPDPSILKDGDDYYMTFSSFEASPGLVIWHSQDLVNWTPVGPALTRLLGSVFAVDLCKHNGRYYIYIPVIPTEVSEGMNGSGIYVIHADDIRGPWSEPVALNISGFIDPGHIVGEDGKRYLFLSGVSRVRLTDDGLATDGPIEHVYDGWSYPDDWVTEAYALEGPKMLRRNGWFYLVSAVGGTSGPPTGHMVIVARSRSIHGPWENHPSNPVIRTRSDREYWWSRGHATFVEGPAGDWWAVYHGYENNYRTLGRQTLLEPIEWRADGWPYARGGDLSKPLPSPTKASRTGPHGIPISDDFIRNRIGQQWTFYAPAKSEQRRIRYENSSIVLTGKGTSPSDCSPLTCLVGDLAYEISVEMEVGPAAQGGLLLFYDRRLYLGMGHDGKEMATYQCGEKVFYWKEPAPATRRLHLKIVNDHHIVTFYYSTDGKSWTRHGLRSETSGYHSNTVGGLLSLRPALFAAGSGEVRFRHFQYRGLS